MIDLYAYIQRTLGPLARLALPMGVGSGSKTLRGQSPLCVANKSITICLHMINNDKST